MKKLIILMVALVLLFTACGNDNKDNTDSAPAQNGIVDDGDGIIDESMDNDANNDNSVGTDMENGVEDAVDGVVDGADDLVDGAADATKDAADGVKDAADSMTGNNSSK